MKNFYEDILWRPFAVFKKELFRKIKLFEESVRKDKLRPVLKLAFLNKKNKC